MDKHAVKLASSILAADFARLVEQVAAADRPVTAAGNTLPLELHLMIPDPDFFLEPFTEAGSDAFLVFSSPGKATTICTSSPRNPPAKTFLLTQSLQLVRRVKLSVCLAWDQRLIAIGLKSYTEGCTTSSSPRPPEPSKRVGP